MKISRQTVGTVDVLAPSEALLDDAAEQFLGAVRTAISSRNPRVVVDMKDVGYLDSIALEGFVQVADELRSRSAQLKVSGVTPTCREILELTGLGDRFQFFESVDGAVRSFL